MGASTSQCCPGAAGGGLLSGGRLLLLLLAWGRGALRTVAAEGVELALGQLVAGGAGLGFWMGPVLWRVVEGCEAGSAMSLVSPLATLNCDCMLGCSWIKGQGRGTQCSSCPRGGGGGSSKAGQEAQ